MSERKDPLEFECPQCGAKKGERCRSKIRHGKALARGSHIRRGALAAGTSFREHFDSWFRREVEAIKKGETA